MTDPAATPDTHRSTPGTVSADEIRAALDTAAALGHAGDLLANGSRTAPDTSWADTINIWHQLRHRRLHPTETLDNQPTAADTPDGTIT